LTGKRYRLKSPTLAIVVLDGHSVPITIPTGSVIQIKHGPLDGERLVDVEWDNRTVSMFTIDLRDRGEELE
jgi:hypothetical protein